MNGYNTVALHTFSKKFWARDQAFPRIGFNQFYAVEDIPETSGEGLVFLEDSILYKYIQQTILENKKDQPLFLYGITMQAHGRYDSPGRYPRQADLPPYIASKLDPDERKSLAVYAQIIREHEKATCNLIDWLKTRERETILIYFGDHLPALGKRFAPYEKLGIVSRGEPAQKYRDHRKLYTTPLFIWSNERGFIALPDSPIPTFALGATIFGVANIPVPPHFQFAAKNSEILKNVACCYVDKSGRQFNLNETTYDVLYRHAWDRLFD